MKFKELKQMSRSDREKKLKDLKLEMVKSKGKASKTGSSKSREIRKMVARIITLNKSASFENKSQATFDKKVDREELKNK